MAVDPLGSMSLVKERAGITLADCPTWRTLTATATTAAAKARIHLDGIPPPANGVKYTLEEAMAYRPCATIWLDPHGGYRCTRDSVNGFRESGRLYVELWRTIADPPKSGPDSDVDREWSNIVGAIVDELWERNGRSGEGGQYLDFWKSEVWEPRVSPPESALTQGPWQVCTLALDFGP